MTTPTPDREMIERLVAEVIRRLQPSAAPRAHPPSSAAVSSVQAVVDESVVTAGLLGGLPPGVRELVVEPRAVITPAARDRAREAGIVIVRRRVDAAAQRGIPLLVVAAHRARGEVVRRAAAITRAVAHARQLPAAGPAEAIALVAQAASRDSARAVLLTDRPHLAAVLANRSPALRAVTAGDAARLAGAAAECAANLLIVDPLSFAGDELERACATFAVGPIAAPPPELATAAATCGCRPLPH